MNRRRRVKCAREEGVRRGWGVSTPADRRAARCVPARRGAAGVYQRAVCG